MSAATILTLANGRGVDLLDPRAADVDFDSLAEHLAKENRYNGATPGVTYSVAEHLGRGCEAILKATHDAELAAYWSLHDAPEAVLKDDTTPKKRALAELAQEHFGVLAGHVIATFDLLTDRHDAAIHEAAGLPWPMPQRLIAAVKRWDLVMFVTEWRDLMKNAPHPNWAPYSGLKPLDEVIVPAPWPKAKAELLKCWRRLLPSLSSLAHEKTREIHAGPSA